jgi:hypothetical protein
MNYDQAYERVNQLKKFYKSLTWFGIIAAILFFNDCFEHGRINFTFFNGSIILTIWAIFLAVKAVKLFIFNSEWENDLLEKEMRKDKQPINFKN